WCHGTGASGDFSAPDEYAAAGELFALPDVFRTAQTLARAVSRQASALIMESDQNGAGASGWANGSVSNGHISTGAAPFHASNGVRLDPLQQRGPDRTNVHTGDSSAQNDCQDTSSFEV
ncbi:unnamed protein product, partial [Sphacelaria rigidula]